MTPRERHVVLAGLLLVYAASRLVGIDALPAFIDLAAPPSSAVARIDRAHTGTRAHYAWGSASTIW